MELVVDANVVISALIRDSHARDLLVLGGNSLFVPEFVFAEIARHSRTIEEKSGLPAAEVKKLLGQVMAASGMRIIPFSEYKGHYGKAKGISPDPDDAHYFALALHLGCAIWSNDKKLKEQDQIRVVNTAEVTEQRA